MKHIYVTGGCGYKGSVLVPKLLKNNYYVTVLDTQWFGNYLEDHKNLNVIKGDVRDINSIDLNNVDTIIHLSSVANDPCGDLNPKLTWEISALATMQLAEKASNKKVSQFIYASSGSVYGVSDKKNVTEEVELNPISEYNKTKMVSERVLLSYSNKMSIQIVRPATVCGYSPRMRLDISVNALTMSALEQSKIFVHGGTQIRPNIHIDDITDLYLFLIEHGSEFNGIYNAGFENLSILETANKVSNTINSAIEVEDSIDPRSYRINSDKLLSTGFKPKKTVADAIKEMKTKYEEGRLKNDSIFHNLKWMQKNPKIMKD